MSEVISGQYVVEGSPAKPVHVTNEYVPVFLVQGSGGSEDTDQPLMVDELTGALATIDTVHHEVHEGEMFYVSHSASVNNASSMDVQILTGAGGLHMSSAVSVGGACNLYLYEAPSTSGGSALTSYNKKRDDTTHSSPMTVVHTPSVSGTGTTLINGRLLAGGNTQQSRIGTGVRDGSEWILKPSTKYLIRVTNVSGTAITISVEVEGYAA